MWRNLIHKNMYSVNVVISVALASPPCLVTRVVHRMTNARDEQISFMKCAEHTNRVDSVGNLTIEYSTVVTTTIITYITKPRTANARLMYRFKPKPVRVPNLGSFPHRLVQAAAFCFLLFFLAVTRCDFFPVAIFSSASKARRVRLA